MKKKNKTILIIAITAVPVLIFFNSKNFYSENINTETSAKKTLNLPPQTDLALTQVENAQGLKTSNQASRANPVPFEPQNTENKPNELLVVPKALFQTLGGLAQQAWDQLAQMSFDEALKSSAYVSFGNVKLKGQNISPYQFSNNSKKNKTDDKLDADELIGKNELFVHWGDKNGCKDKPLPAKSDKNNPMKSVGFILRTYDEYRILLKQTFVPINQNDLQGCDYYEIALKDLLPTGILSEQFNGFLAVTTAMGESRIESQEVFLNLDKPKGLATKLIEK